MKQGGSIFSNGMKAFLAPAVISLLFGGAWFYHDQEDGIRKRVEEDLNAIARLKVDQIAAWRERQLADAASLQLHPILSTVVLRFMAEESAQNRRELLVRFRAAGRAAPLFSPMSILSLSPSRGGHVWWVFSGISPNVSGRRRSAKNFRLS